MPLYLKRGAVYDLDSTAAQKKQRLNFIEDTLLAAGQPEAAGYVQAISDASAKLGGDQVVPADFAQASSGAPRGGSSRTSTRSGSHRMAKAWRSRRHKHGPGKRFQRKVRSVILRTLETKRSIVSVSEATFTCGDGTTRVLYIANPISQILQDSTSEGMTGDKIFVQGLWLRGRIALDQTTNTLKVRVMCIKSHQFADLPVGWTTYGNTTTALTNPTQTAADNEQNVWMFESTAAEIAAQPSAPYVGNSSGIDIIDNDYVQVVKAREYWMSPDRTAPFRDVDFYVPVNRFWKRASLFQAAPTDQIRSYRQPNYYFVMQVFSNTNANNILAAQDIVGTFDLIAYFKDV